MSRLLTLLCVQNLFHVHWIYSLHTSLHRVQIQGLNVFNSWPIYVQMLWCAQQCTGSIHTNSTSLGTRFCVDLSLSYFVSVVCVFSALKYIFCAYLAKLAVLVPCDVITDLTNTLMTWDKWYFGNFSSD